MVAGFIATTISSYSTRPVYPRAEARITNQVGKPLILEGKIFFPEVRIPMRNNARYRMLFAVALPDPLTVQMVIHTSLTICSLPCTESCVVSSITTISPFTRTFGEGPLSCMFSSNQNGSPRLHTLFHKPYLRWHQASGDDSSRHSQGIHGHDNN